MTEDTSGDGAGYSDEAGTGVRIDADATAIRRGDRIVHTTDLGKEYEFTVDDVDETWVTFETGQQVHRDRFDREDFAVVPTASMPSVPTVPAADADAPDRDVASGDGSAPAAGGDDLRPPNLD